MVDQGQSRLNYEEDPVNIALWILPCLAFACAGTPDRPVEAATSPKRGCRDAIEHFFVGPGCVPREMPRAGKRRQAIPCEYASMHPEFYTETERIRCEYVAH